MKTNQAEELDPLLNQSTKVLNNNCNIKEIDASTTSKQDNRSPLPFNCKATQMDIIMDESRDTDLIFSIQQTKLTGMSKSIVTPQEVASTNLDTCTYSLLYIAPQIPYCLAFQISVPSGNPVLRHHICEMKYFMIR